MVPGSARLLLLMSLFGVLGVACAWAEPSSPPSPESSVDPGSDQGAAIVGPAVQALVTTLGKPARLDVKQLKTSGDWAFVYATVRGDDGGPIDYTGTPYAEAAANHAKSRSYAGLLRRSGTGWTVTEQAIGPTDPAWLAWPRQYGVPDALVAVPAN